MTRLAGRDVFHSLQLEWRGPVSSQISGNGVWLLGPSPRLILALKKILKTRPERHEPLASLEKAASPVTSPGMARLCRLIPGCTRS
ncbi:MAG: hypothetical protein CMJ81_23635 [Planctomycetaceae bacterium]|nr:hypothetical protein [Planctomycetaceae bacterium]MBP61687.1 hypothetical protein [Planctomycetaceae bacterium]